jgi:mRNA interferase MazF
VAPVTRTVRIIPSEVVLSREDGMSEACAVNCDHIQTVSKGRIGPIITTLGPQKMHEIRDAIAFALGFWPVTEDGPAGKSD